MTDGVNSSTKARETIDRYLPSLIHIVSNLITVHKEQIKDLKNLQQKDKARREEHVNSLKTKRRLGIGGGVAIVAGLVLAPIAVAFTIPAALIVGSMAAALAAGGTGAVLAGQDADAPATAAQLEEERLIAEFRIIISKPDELIEYAEKLREKLKDVMDFIIKNFKLNSADSFLAMICIATGGVDTDEAVAVVRNSNDHSHPDLSLWFEEVRKFLKGQDLDEFVSLITKLESVLKRVMEKLINDNMRIARAAHERSRVEEAAMKAIKYINNHILKLKAESIYLEKILKRPAHTKP